MRIEFDLRDDEPRRVSGTKGILSARFSRTFTSATTMQKWIDANDAAGNDVMIDEIRRID